ncbi:MAG: large conductance mechanosensitive channel protein MscL [Acidobacteriota bacterium]|jgi:large conductance mechanosensitive channel|nr:MAG: large conductance mechanosensitive channel protein MscL [Acidobacteriota bacterium]
MLQEFKTFAMRGNVVDMAVGIVIGAAFSAIVSGLVDQILMPVVGLVTGGVDFSNMFILLREGTVPGPYPSLDAAKEAGAVVIGYGAVVNALVHFLIVAFALFLVVKAVNRMRAEPEPAPPAPPEPTREEQLLTEIRDLLARR